MLWPYSSGSIRLLLTNSSTTIRATTASGCAQPGSTATLNVTGSTAPSHGPT